MGFQVDQKRPSAIIRHCKTFSIDVINSFLFKPLALPRLDWPEDAPLTSSCQTAMMQRYLPPEKTGGKRFTAHSARAGCATMLALLGATQEQIKEHVRWSSDRVYEHYTKMHQINRLENTASLISDALSKGPKGQDADAKAVFHEYVNSGRGQEKAY